MEAEVARWRTARFNGPRSITLETGAAEIYAVIVLHCDASLELALRASSAACARSDGFSVEAFAASQ